jgi:hypothetical protein
MAAVHRHDALMTQKNTVTAIFWATSRAIIAATLARGKQSIRLINNDIYRRFTLFFSR